MGEFMPNHMIILNFDLLLLYTAYKALLHSNTGQLATEFLPTGETLWK
jgi:hypothetical protein